MASIYDFKIKNRKGEEISEDPEPKGMKNKIKELI